MKKLLSLSVSLFLVITMQAQQKFTATAVNKSSVTSLSSHFFDYAVFKINTQAIRNYVSHADNEIALELELPTFTNWKFSLEAHDILSSNYTLTVNGPTGKTTTPKPACITYRGFLSDAASSRVSLTITDDMIYGLIKKNNTEYFIEPLNYFDKQAAGDLFVVYESKNIKNDPSKTCGVTEMQNHKESVSSATNSGTNCVQTQLAIASDASMFTQYGSAVAVQNHNIGVMNNVIWDYVNNQFNDNIEFVIVTQNVSTVAANDQLSPAYTGTNSNTILANFRTWGEAGGFGATTYDDAQFWTTRNIDADGAGGNSGIIGLAYVGAVCSSFRYHILEDFAGTNPTGSGYQLRVLTSHEIGHNFNCSHDAAGDPYIMAPSVGNVSAWSPASVTSVNGFVPGASCLSACSLAGAPVTRFISSPEAICTGGTFQLTDHTLQGPTSWSWTMSGGTPSTSSARNPTVTYAANGVKTVTLTTSNANGNSSFTKFLVVSTPAAAACTNAGASTSVAGIKGFTLNNINKVSGSPSADGNKYMDFSCTDVTSLSPNTSYTGTITLGDAGTTTFNNFIIYIDYNNDGDFADAGERVFTAGSCYYGTISFSFTTAASPSVFNQILRLRVVAPDCVGSTDPCYNPPATGQVEDYGVVFFTGTVLPVKLISFDGYHNNGANHLNWKTTNEINFDHFEIERSLDGLNFTKLGSVNANTTGGDIKNYSFTDGLAGITTATKVYYRLKIADANGSYTYSRVVIISSEKNNGLLISLYPNPFNEILTATLQLKSQDQVKVILTDATGKIVYQSSKILQAGTHTVSYDEFKKLSSGSYIFTISTGTEQISRVIEKL